MIESEAKESFTVADYLLTRLKQLRVDHVFQIPGDYVKHFTQALEHFEGIETVAGINELEAALRRLPGIQDRPTLVEVVIPQKDLPGQMKRLASG